MDFTSDTTYCVNHHESTQKSRSMPFARCASRRNRISAVFALTVLAGLLAFTAGASGEVLRDSVRSDSALAASGPAAGRDYIAEVRSNFTPENRRYSNLRSALGFAGVGWDVALGLFLLFSGLSARFRDAAYRRSGNRYMRMLVYFALFTGVGLLLSLPFNWYRGFYVEHAFGLSNQSLSEWFLDELKGGLVTVIGLGATGLVALAYLGIEKSPRRWWLWLAAGTLPVLLIAQVLVPIAVDPLFNRFTPLRDQQLKAQILSLAERAGIPGRNVYEVDRSRQTKKFNAYVSGWGVSQRIVLWDTTLKGMKTDEILFVMAHEMGHYRLAHIWKGVLYASALSFVLFFLSGILMRRAVARFGPRWGFTELHDAASVPLFMVAVTLLSFVADPLSNMASRVVEHEADVFAVEVTHDNDAGARTFLKLGSQNRSNPEPAPVIVWFQYSHPPLIERIRFALEYRPWEEGKPNRFYRPVNR